MAIAIVDLLSPRVEDLDAAEAGIDRFGECQAQLLRRLAQAGADYIVPGSLMFGEDPAAMRAWLSSL